MKPIHCLAEGAGTGTPASGGQASRHERRPTRFARHPGSGGNVARAPVFASTCQKSGSATAAPGMLVVERSSHDAVAMLLSNAAALGQEEPRRRAGRRARIWCTGARSSTTTTCLLGPLRAGRQQTRGAAAPPRTRARRSSSARVPRRTNRSSRWRAPTRCWIVRRCGSVRRRNQR
jgi:hypothetical protein